VRDVNLIVTQVTPNTNSGLSASAALSQSGPYDIGDAFPTEVQRHGVHCH
jgi:hypothetical protein